MSIPVDDLSRTDQLVRELRRRYPDSVPSTGRLREDPPTDTTWPQWCWLPMGGFHAYLNAAGPTSAPADLARVTALTLWRLGRGLYRPEHAVAETAVAELYSSGARDARDWASLKLPPLQTWAAALPEWCVYLSMPELDEPVPDMPLGVYVHLEHDTNNGRPELRLLLDLDGTWDGLLPIPIYLDRPTLGAAIGDSEANARAVAELGATGTDLRSMTGAGTAGQMTALTAWKVLPLVLTLLDDRARFRAHHDATATPTPATAISGLWRPVKDTRVWDITYDNTPHLHSV